MIYEDPTAANVVEKRLRVTNVAPTSEQMEKTAKEKQRK
jgi:hypothetical protein